ncbi:MAG: membrane protein [Gammaproteobacteria bacterium BRH_c0]|nr:MAG: membrane protein [Gammaproteobacteria bacterium BRH_c0]
MTAPDTPPGSKLEQRTFLLLLLIVTGLFFYLLKPFFAPVFWACAISVLFYPVQERLLRRWGDRPNLIALATLLLCVVLVVIPVLLILTSFVQEGANLYQKIESGEIKPDTIVDRIRSALPSLQIVLDRLGMDMESLKQRASDSALAASSFVAKNAFSLGQSTFQFFLSLGLMLYMLFFLLRDGSRLVQLIARALPLGDERERLLFQKFSEVTRATVKGSLVVAIVQGALGGLIFWILDIPAPILWAVVMAALSLIPAVGAGLVWLPFSIYLFAVGDLTSAIILVLYGFLVIGLADNLLRPILVGRDTKLPDWLVLLSTLGGLVMFGINGFVIGPLIAAVFIVFWQIFSRDFNNHELQPLETDSSGSQNPSNLEAPAPIPSETGGD